MRKKKVLKDINTAPALIVYETKSDLRRYAKESLIEEDICVLSGYYKTIDITELPKYLALEKRQIRIRYKLELPKNFKVNVTQKEITSTGWSDSILVVTLSYERARTKKEQLEFTNELLSSRAYEIDKLRRKKKGLDAMFKKYDKSKNF